MNQPTPPVRSRQSGISQRRLGLTVVELLCSVAVTCTALGVSVPGMRDFAQSQRLQAATAELESEIQLAKSLAVVQGQSVRLAIQPLNQGSCTLIHTGPKDACQCGAAGAAVCVTPAAAFHLRRHDAKSGVQFTSTQLSIAFSADRGTVTPTATFKLADAKGRSLHQVVNVMGRTRTCSPQAAIAGYPVC